MAKKRKEIANQDSELGSPPSLHLDKNSRVAEFVKLLNKVTNSVACTEVFADFCHCACLSLRGAVTLNKTEKDNIEAEYKRYVDKYGASGMEKMSELLAYVVEALEHDRSDFLGHVYESLNATKKGWGQFLTPDSLARAMAKMSLSGFAESNEIIKMDDPSCGAGALLIEAAEEFMANGGRQGNLLVYGEDLDSTACYITYIQFSLLGYPAIVTWQDSLSRKVYGGPWYTFGYFAHAMPMRLLCKRATEIENPAETTCEGIVKDKEESEEGVPQGSFHAPEDALNVRELVQGELF